MFTLDVLAGSDFNYTTNLALANNVSWTVNTFLTTTDNMPLYNGNSVIGNLTSNLQPIISTTPNSVNYKLNVSAPASLTMQWIANSVSVEERSLYMFTRFTSGSGSVILANTQILRVLAA